VYDGFWVGLGIVLGGKGWGVESEREGERGNKPDSFVKSKGDTSSSMKLNFQNRRGERGPQMKRQRELPIKIWGRHNKDNGKNWAGTGEPRFKILAPW